MSAVHRVAPVGVAVVAAGWSATPIAAIGDVRERAIGGPGGVTANTGDVIRIQRGIVGLSPVC